MKEKPRWRSNWKAFQPRPKSPHVTAAAHKLGDLVSLAPQAMKPRLRGGACTTEELSRLKVIAIKTGPGGAPLYRLVTLPHHTSIGWVSDEEIEPAK